MEPRMLKTAQAIAYLNIGKTTFYRLRKQGLLPEPKIYPGAKRLIRYDRKDLDKYLDGQRNKVTEYDDPDEALRGLS